MSVLAKYRTERPDLFATARRIAHEHNPRCTGGQWQGSDGTRYHSKSCERLTDEIYIALRGVAPALLTPNPHAPQNPVPYFARPDFTPTGE